MRHLAGMASLVLGLVACSDSSGPASPLAGEWGGEHLGAVFTATGAALEFDCAGGRIDGAVEPDGRGRFAVEGTFTRGGGPLPIDDSTRAVPARYEGTVRGRTMTIVVTLTDTQDVLGPYTLARGANPHVYKCL